MSEAEDPNAVLAFLLGSTPAPPPTDTAPPSEGVESSLQDEPPELEPLSDSDEEEVDEVAPADNSKAVAGLKSKTEANGGSSQEAEHEDDCAPVAEDAAEKQQPGVERTRTKKRRSSESRSASAITKAKANRMSEKKEERLAAGVTLEEFLYVGCVTTVLVAYIVASVYSFFHPLMVPLPDYEALYTAYDISNVSVGIVNPVNDSQITPQGIVFEWQLMNFPTDALYQYGAEVFSYRVSLDDEVIASEIGFLALGENNAADALNRTVRVPIPLRRFARSNDEASDAKKFKLHLDVSIPIPGLIEEFKAFEQSIYVREPARPSPKEHMHLTLTSPNEGATFELGRSIVLEYAAVNVHALEVFVDEAFYVKKTFVSDGNLLLRGLGVARHTLDVKALSERGETTMSSTLHVKVVKRPDTKTA